jgi:hypothetical protein
MGRGKMSACNLPQAQVKMCRAAKRQSRLFSARFVGVLNLRDLNQFTLSDNDSAYSSFIELLAFAYDVSQASI